jgi:hypothetical protein
MQTCADILAGHCKTMVRVTLQWWLARRRAHRRGLIALQGSSRSAMLIMAPADASDR